ncbi:Focal adhesion kinase 1 [Geodia barretti]|uniref:Focal adhesion kinase 1 n=1 Tax=Geodia barretti TaxID=519541 RepID=A0AA35T8W0_GEOBA|nr:Focal adhesion kinase 1 [Geodia barretti]
MLRMRVLPRTPQHLLTQDPVTFQYFYDQVLHSYLVDSEIAVDNETAVKLGCLELRRFFKDMPQVALKKKENFDMLEKDIGLEKFFKSSLLSSLKRKNLRTMVLHAFQNYESLTMEGCIFQFFSLLSKFHSIDVESFQNCAVGDDQTARLSCVIFVGANCNLEYQLEGGERRFLAAFSDIEDVCYESELMSRGRVVMDVRTAAMAVVIRTATMTMAVHLATLIDAYCMVYTPNPHSRMSGIGRKSYSNPRLSGLYSSLEEERMRGVVDHYGISMATHSFTPGDDYAEVREPDRQVLGRAISPREVMLEERIGEGQFGDVHKGTLYPGVGVA